jgi:hypothetical protein
MVHATQPHFMICSKSWKTSQPRLATEVTPLPLPAITDADMNEVDLGQIAGVASDPFDGSIWIFVRCAAAHCEDGGKHGKMEQIQSKACPEAGPFVAPCGHRR